MKIQQKLGYSENTKLLMIHADDAGLCHSENAATIQALKKGHLNSYSIMVPCPGFNEIAEFALENPQLDYGIHLTLSCQWYDFKWGPVLADIEVPSLVDDQGFFFRSRSEIRTNAKAHHVKKELCAQIERALEMGLTPTHLDSHMYTLGLKEDFLKVYQELGKEYKLPILLSKQFVNSFGLDVEQIVTQKDLVIENEIILGDYSYFERGKLIDFYINKLNSLPKGLNMFLLHPAFDNKEMQSITIDHPNFGAKWRQLDYDFVTSDQCLEILKRNNIQMITWGDVQKLLYP